MIRKAFTVKELRDLYRALARQADRAGEPERAARLRAVAKLYAGRDRRRPERCASP